jgi:hypothetical protein
VRCVKGWEGGKGAWKLVLNGGCFFDVRLR